MKFDNVNTAWAIMAHEVLTTGKKVGNTMELSNVSFTVLDPTDNIVKSRDNFSLLYYLGETIWYGAGANDVEFIARFGKIWEKLTDDGIVNNSAYGFILQNKHGFDQIDKMIELLNKDPNSRRAVMNINIPREDVIETKDEMCTIALQLLLRDGKLNMTGIMRSNDLSTGTPYDIFYFTSIQKLIATALGVEIGTYTHFVSSMHFYDRDLEKIKKSIENYRNDIGVNVEIDGQRLLQNSTYFYNILQPLNREETRKEIIRLCEEMEIIKYVD